MKLIDPIREEFARERALTHRVLEALPEDQFGWRPHEKSFTVTQLASHIADIPGWGGMIFGTDLFELDMEKWKPVHHATCTALLEAFDRNADTLAGMLPDITDERLTQNWRMTMDGRTVIDAPRIEVIRSWVLNHIVHHRAQLTVYLRLLGCPVPSVYGPSADDKPPQS
jgi:uncharacterized damage-inducible protein DinB